jgi:hypothetical protein
MARRERDRRRFRNVEGMLSFAAIGYLIRGMTGAAIGILVGGLLVECWQRAIDARHDRERQRRGGESGA